MFFVGILPNAICALLVCMPRMDAPSTRLAAVYESPTADPCTLILPPLEAGEGMWEQLSEALLATACSTPTSAAITHPTRYQQRCSGPPA